MGQEEFYGEQYGHTPSSSEPINQQYYPDGNHTDPHTHSYKQITCLSTSLKHLPHLLLLPHLLFLFPVFFFGVFCFIFLFFYVFTHIGSSLIPRSDVFFWFQMNFDFLYYRFLSQVSEQIFFFFNRERLWCAEISDLVPFFFLYLFVYGIRYRDVCSTYCMCI